MSDDGAPVDCGVVGGGPSGLVLALLLARRGRHVTVLERGEDQAKISPFLSPPSLRLFEDLGLLGELNRIGRPVREVVEFFPDDDPYVLDYEERAGGDFGYALSVPLRDLTRVLREALVREATATVSTGVSVLGVTESAAGVHLDLADEQGTRTLTCRHVVSSDGKFSKVREMAGIEAEVVEFDRPLVMMVMPAPAGWPARLALHHGERDSLVAVMPVAEDILVVQWLADPGEFEAVRAAGVDALRSRVIRALPELEAPLAAGVTRWEQVLVVRHHVVRPASWSRGAIVLLGDSAHGVHSLGGQGLNMGIQDAMVLAYSLIATDTPFSVYEQLRRPFVERYQRYQLGVPQLRSQPGDAAGQRAIYQGIADVVTRGQPEAETCYQRLATL
ncbi:FAD-dependent oxidoreductase [Nonomuraea typhae]|uniref:FAD-dependent oxidoreductase n=1 Tax=Nonomuraea typhae TaxID=2603600 RepID=UPI0012FBE341|nr:NAD(P)/FAD-dependent oxidoreductase [Nonomuraea typhae]